MVTRWETSGRYEPYYLEDMVNGFKYTDSDYITKNSYLQKGTLTGKVEHDYTDEISNIYATLFWSSSVEYKDFLAMENGAKRSCGYSIDHFNYEKL